MGCNVDFSSTNDISYSCDELSTGGLKTVYLVDRADLVANGDLSVSTGTGVITGTGLVNNGVDVLTLGFNNKDGFSNFTDVKTLNADGSGSAVPTIQLEFIRMGATLRDALETIARPGAELVAFVETAAGTCHIVGYDFGLYAGTVDGASGVARTDKNRFQLTLVGDENVLSYPIAKSEFDKVPVA